MSVLGKSLRPCEVFRDIVCFYSKELAPRPTPELEDNPLSAVGDCLFNIFADILHLWRHIWEDNIKLYLQEVG